MKDIHFITRQILGFRLAHTGNLADAQALVHQFLSFGTSYTVADLNTTQADWDANEFGVFIQNQEIFLFLAAADAESFAFHVGAVIRKNIPLVKKVSTDMIKSVIADYFRKGFIQQVCICGISPIKVSVDAKLFINGLEHSLVSTIMNEPVVKNESRSSPDVSPQKGLKLIDEIKSTLILAEAKDRKAFDPGKVYENFHTLLERVIYANQLDMSHIDELLGLPDGYTKQVCMNQVSSTIPLKILKDYLLYLGIPEFLYLFKAQSDELAAALKNMGKVDQYSLKHSTVKTAERFELINIRRGKDKNQAYVYQVELKSCYRKETVIVSSNFGLIVGKNYEIDGLPPINDESQIDISIKGAAFPSASIPDFDESEQDKILKEIQEQDIARQDKTPPQRAALSGTGGRMGRSRYEKTEEEKAAEQTNTILRYIIQTNGCSSKEAKAKLEPLTNHPKVISSFTDYINGGNYNRCKIRDYTPKRLMNDLKYNPYEAYLMLAQLEDDPKRALEMLKYRETDPQYQTLKNKSDNR